MNPPLLLHWYQHLPEYSQPQLAACLMLPLQGLPEVRNETVQFALPPLSAGSKGIAPVLSWVCEKADISQLTDCPSQDNPTRNCSSPIILRNRHALHTGIPQNNTCHWTQQTQIPSMFHILSRKKRCISSGLRGSVKAGSLHLH